MNQAVLEESVQRYVQWTRTHLDEQEQALAERAERKAFYQSWKRDRLLAMDEDNFLEFMSKLWALRTWGNKPYVVNHIIERNGLEKLCVELAELVWGDRPISIRWDRFRKSISDMGPAQMSEILCHVHPNDYLLWNRRVYEGFLNLEVAETPRYDYQINGERYEKLC